MYINTFTYTYLHMYLYAYIHICIYVYIYIYIHTCINATGVADQVLGDLRPVVPTDHEYAASRPTADVKDVY